MTRTKSTFLAVVAVLLSPMAANADFIGDTVTMGHYFPVADGTGICPPACGGLVDVVVAAGAGDVTQPYLPGDGWYFVDVEASSLSVLYGRSPSWSAADFNGLIVSGLDWIGELRSIVGIDVSTNLPGFDLDRVTFSADSISINWQGLSFDAGTRWDIDIITAAVPEPGTLALLGIGLLGMGMTRRRKKA